MLTNKITGFSADLLNTVRGILGEAKHDKKCKCEKCEAEEMKEGYVSAAQRKAVWANRADDGAGHPDKKKLKEEILEMVNEAAGGLADKAKKSGVSLSTLKKVYARGIAAWNSGHRPGTTPQQWAHARVNSYITKGKGTYHGADKDLRSEGADVPFDPPYSKPGERKDAYGNKVKNVAKYLAKKAMNDLAKKNEEAEHNNCGTPECCGQCDTPTQIDETAKIVAHLQKRYGDNIRKSHVRSAANDFGVDASKLAKAVRTKLGKSMLDEEENDEGWYTHSQMYGSKKSEKHPKGISAAEWKSGIRWHHGKNKRINIKEEVEQIDEEPTDPNYHAKVHQDLQWHASRNKGSHMGAANYNYLASLKNQSHIENHYEKTVLPILKKHGYPAPPEGPGASGNEKYHNAVQETIKKWKNERRVSDVNESTKVDEEVEQIDELSKGTMGRYINKAADRMSTQGVTAGLKIAADEKSKKNFDTIAKRQKGIATAVKKLTKEEQDFIDSLNDADAEQIDELSKDTMLKYLSANKKSGKTAQDAGDLDKMTKRMRGTDVAVRKYTAKPGSKSVRVPATEETQIDEISDATLKSYSKKALDQSKTLTGDQKVKRQVGARNAIDRLGNNTLAKEEVELDEARGRPRKAGAKDFTIHPKTKEKLMHNNPEHMKKIEALQRNGVIPVPKVEAGQHIMNQLSKAKTSMLGGSKIHFTHGDSKEVSGTHAAKILTKYAGLKPNEKEDFQKFVGHSHENLMKHV